MLKLSPNLLVRPKVFWPSLIILLVTSVTFYILKEKEKSLKIYTQRQLVETTLEKEAFENELAITFRKKEILQEELVAERERSYVLEKEVEEKEHQIKLVLDKLEKEIISRRIAEIQLILATKEKRALRAKLRLRQLTEAPDTIELEKVVVKAAPVLVGKILVVNKSEAFIVVNLGRADNLRLEEVLSIYRNGEFIGRVQVERVQERVSAAAILPEWQGAEFKENDDVRGI